MHTCMYIYFTIRDIFFILIKLSVFHQGTKSGVFLRSCIPDIGVL